MQKRVTFTDLVLIASSFQVWVPNLSHRYRVRHLCILGLGARHLYAFGIYAVCVAGGYECSLFWERFRVRTAIACKTLFRMRWTTIVRQREPRLLEHLDTKIGAERVGKSPRQHRTAHPVHNDHQLEKALGHRMYVTSEHQT